MQNRIVFQITLQFSRRSTSDSRVRSYRSTLLDRGNTFVREAGGRARALPPRKSKERDFAGVKPCPAIAGATSRDVSTRGSWDAAA